MSPLPEQVGRYRIVSEIGRGAMGAVYRAHDPQLDRPVAIKMISSPLAEGTLPADEAEARFLREARVAARLHHPSVVAVFDAGKEGRDLYLVMELVEGESLAHRLASGTYPTPAEALEWTAQAAEALAAAHAAGIVHRDIKPANILLTKSEQVKVSDFGVAKAVDERTELTRSGMLVGSPAYMSPEQIKGQVLDGRSDLFSLGVVLYEMLLRRKPFPADTVTTLVYQILHEDPLSDPGTAVAVGPEYAELLRWCLAKDLALRVPDGKSLAARARALAARVAASGRVETPTTMLPTAAPLPPLTRTSPTAKLSAPPPPPVAPPDQGRTAPTVISPVPPPPVPPRPAAVPPPPPPPPAVTPVRSGPATATGTGLVGVKRGTWIWLVGIAAVVVGVAAGLLLFRRPAPPPPLSPLAGVGDAATKSADEIPPPVGTPFSAADLRAPQGSATPAAIPTATPTAEAPYYTPPAPTATAAVVAPARPTAVVAPVEIPSSGRGTASPSTPAPAIQSVPVTPAVETKPPIDPSRYAVRFTCRKEVEFGVSPEDAKVTIDGTTIGIADDWDGMGGGKAWKFPGPGYYVAVFTMKGYESAEVLLIADPKAKSATCEVDTELKEKD